MATAILQQATALRRDDVRLAELVGFLAGYPTLDALEVVQTQEDRDPLARVAAALVRIKRSRNGIATTR